MRKQPKIVVINHPGRTRDAGYDSLSRPLRGALTEASILAEKLAQETDPRMKAVAGQVASLLREARRVAQNG